MEQVIDTYDGLPGWHVHLDYTMQSTAAPAGAMACYYS